MQHLLRYLITSFLLVITNLLLTANAEISTYPGSESDLQSMFNIQTEFVSNGLMSLQFKRSGLSVFNEKQCSIGVYVRYLVENGVGNALRTISYFKETESFLFEVFDKSQQYNGSIYLSFNIEKGDCVLDKDYSYTKSYFFSQGILGSMSKDRDR